MNGVPRRKHLSFFVSSVGGLTLALIGVCGGCSGRAPTTPKAKATDIREDPLQGGLNRLDRAEDVTVCRDSLLTIESSPAYRGQSFEPAAADQGVLKQLRLAQPEIEAIYQATFTGVDSEYLLDCLVLRDAMRSLELGGRPPLEQAERAFSWVCRQVYLSNTLHPPAPPWMILHAGSGGGFDRAYVFLSALQQLGLDGCLVGPANLETAARMRPGPNGRPVEAPVGAVGVLIDEKIYLFDPWLGEPVAADGKTAALEQLQTNPTAFQGWLQARSISPDDVKTWAAVLSAPLQALEPRMRWLEKELSSAGITVRLYVDLGARKKRFEKILPGTACRIWGPPNDPLFYTRIWDTFYRETKDRQNGLRYQFEESHFPRKYIPTVSLDGTGLDGAVFEMLNRAFRGLFTNWFLTPSAPRDQVVRGNYSSAVVALIELKERNDRANEQTRGVEASQEGLRDWAKQAIKIRANISRAEQSGDAAALQGAIAAEEEFRREPVSVAVFNLILKNASTLLAADASYQLALVAQEKMEHAMVRWQRNPGDKQRAEVSKLSRAAADDWQRYLDNYPELRDDFADRDRHAQQLLRRCRMIEQKVDAKADTKE